MNLANLKEKNGFSSWSHLVKFDHATSQTDYFKKMSNLKWNKFCKIHLNQTIWHTIDAQLVGAH